jgi:hypothetical protein
VKEEQIRNSREESGLELEEESYADWVFRYTGRESKGILDKWASKHLRISSEKERLKAVDWIWALMQEYGCAKVVPLRPRVHGLARSQTIPPGAPAGTDLIVGRYKIVPCNQKGE